MKYGIQNFVEKHYRDYLVNYGSVPKEHIEAFVRTMVTDFTGSDGNKYNPTISAIKEIVEKTLELASEKAKLTDFAQEFLQEGASDAIDKESITDVAKLINYES